MHQFTAIYRDIQIGNIPHSNRYHQAASPLASYQNGTIPIRSQINKLFVISLLLIYESRENASNSIYLWADRNEDLTGNANKR